jgi:PAS domain S-box-containing protein
LFALDQCRAFGRSDRQPTEDLAAVSDVSAEGRSDHERRHRAIFDSAVDFAIVATDLMGAVTDWNRGAERIFGWSSAEMFGEPAEVFFTPEDRSEGRPSYEMRQALEAGRASDERWHLRKDGTRFWASGEMMPLRGDGGAHVGYLKIVRDRTQHRLDAEKQRADAEFLRGLLASSADCIKVLDLDGNLLFMSEGGMRVMEVDDFESIRGCPWPDLWRGQGNADALAALETARNGGVGHFLGAAETMAGNMRHWDVQVTPMLGADGMPEKLLSVTRDITDQRQAESAQRETDALYRLSSQAGRTGAWEMDLRTKVCVLSAEMATLLGMAAERISVAAANWRAAILAEDRPEFEHALARSNEGMPFECEFRVAMRDGVERTLYARGAVVRDIGGTLARINGVCVDVTERRRSQEALRQSEGYVRMLLDSMSEGFYAVDRNGVMTLCNPSFLRKLGFRDEAEALGRSLHDVIHHTHSDGSHYPASDCPIYICARTGAAAHVTGEHFFRLDGTSFPTEYWAQPILRDGVVEGAVCTFLDITERLRAEAAIKESEARFRHLADSAPSLIWMMDQSGRWTFANMHFGHMFGRDADDFLHGAWDEVLMREDIPLPRAEFAEARSARRPFAAEVRAYDAERRVRWLRCECVVRTDDLGNYLGYTCCGTDITEARTAAEELEARVQSRTSELSTALDRLQSEVVDRERAEAQLRQAQKMEAVGQLTGGLAHDFNNLLTGIAGSLELLRSRISQGRFDTLDRYLDAARNASDRAAALTHRLLAYSRQQTLAPAAVDANQLARSMEELIRRTVGPAIQFDTDYAPDLWATLCDPHQLENALLNLCINARDAMPDGGRLVIQTLNAELRGGIATDRDMTPGDYVEIRVTDTGVGMSPETVARAFEPFYTTKPIGQGTGLGLSMIYGFARQSGGQVRIHSSQGVGTTMRIYLPRFAGTADAAEEESAPAAAGRAEAGETVLVVDDEPTIRMLVSEVLEDLGYRILEAETGADGLELLRSDARIDLLVTDVGLPGGMNGRQVADAGRKLRPGLKVLYVTGYAESAVMGTGHLETGMHVLVKPFGLDDLAVRIRTIIEGE